MSYDNFENKFDQIKRELKARWKVLTDRDLENFKWDKTMLINFIGLYQLVLSIVLSALF